MSCLGLLEALYNLLPDTDRPFQSNTISERLPATLQLICEKYPPLSIARYTFIQFELEQCRMNEYVQGSTRQPRI